jgi:hypothetical protein
MDINKALNVQGAVTATNFTGSLLGTASYAQNAASAVSSSYANNATTANSATTAASATSASYAQNATTANNALTASTAVSSSYAVNATNANVATSASIATTANSATSASYADSSSFATSASQALTASELNPVTSLYVDEIYSKDGTVTPSNRIFTKNNNPVWGGIGDIVLYGSADDIYLHTPGGDIRLNAGNGMNSVQITGSLHAPSITGSLFGTASYALTASNVEGGAANYLPLWLDNTKLTSSIVYQNATGIGIDDVVPTHKFQVNGNSLIYNTANTLNTNTYAL